MKLCAELDFQCKICTVCTMYMYMYIILKGPTCIHVHVCTCTCVEHSSREQSVVGSNPTCGSSFFFGKKSCLGVVVLCCIVLLCLLSPEFIMYMYTMYM